MITFLEVDYETHANHSHRNYRSSRDKCCRERLRLLRFRFSGYDEVEGSCKGFLTKHASEAECESAVKTKNFYLRIALGTYAHLGSDSSKSPV